MTITTTGRRAYRRVVPPGVRVRIAGRRPPAWAVAVYAGQGLHSLRPFGSDGGQIWSAEERAGLGLAAIGEPFALRREDSWWLFFEQLRHGIARGEIGVASSRDLVSWRYHGVALRQPMHLSYPYVFDFDGATWMIPECATSQSVPLLRATDFPLRWERVGSLVEGRYFKDSSVFRWADRWWLLTESSMRYDDSELRLFHSDCLTGTWHEHPASPLPVPAGGARPAGRPLVTDEGPIRFAQDSASTYGRRVMAYAIDELTPTTYAEHPLGPVLAASGAGWNAAAMHHLDAHPVKDGLLAFVDGHP